MKRKPMTISRLKKKAQTIFNSFIRKRDQNPDGTYRCIACGVITNHPNAAHYANIKLYPHLAFDEQNVHVCCIRCNMCEGNLIGYRRGLIKKIGEEAVMRLEHDALSAPIIKRDKSYYEHIANKYKLYNVIQDC